MIRNSTTHNTKAILSVQLKRQPNSTLYTGVKKHVEAQKAIFLNFLIKLVVFLFNLNIHMLFKYHSSISMWERSSNSGTSGNDHSNSFL